MAVLIDRMIYITLAYHLGRLPHYAILFVLVPFQIPGIGYKKSLLLPA
jgi:hypothetical protein